MNPLVYIILGVALMMAGAFLAGTIVGESNCHVNDNTAYTKEDVDFVVDSFNRCMGELDLCRQTIEGMYPAQPPPPKCSSPEGCTTLEILNYTNHSLRNDSVPWPSVTPYSNITWFNFTFHPYHDPIAYDMTGRGNSTFNMCPDDKYGIKYKPLEVECDCAKNTTHPCMLLCFKCILE